jgi:hypothetical protein
MLCRERRIPSLREHAKVSDRLRNGDDFWHVRNPEPQRRLILPQILGAETRS